MRKQHEQTAGDGKILFEMQELIAIAESGVKQNRGGDAKAREQERGSAGVVAAQDEKPTAQFEHDGERQQLPGDAKNLVWGLSVSRKKSPCVESFCHVTRLHCGNGCSLARLR